LGLTCILAEKPDVAKNISFALKASDRKDGYFEGNGYLVTYSFGHLLTLWDAVDYDPKFKEWKSEYFPFIPDTFKYKLIDDAGVKKQFKVIKTLVNRPDVDCVIQATDNDREGQLLGSMILKATETKKPIKRLLADEWTPDDIHFAMKHLKDDKDMVPLQDSGYTRQLADWLIGINLTSVCTDKFGNGVTLNIGRVIMPTVKLVYDRDTAIRSFKPVPYFMLNTVFNAPEGTYSGIYYNAGNESRFEDKTILESIINSLEGSSGSIISKTVKPSKESPKSLFNLNDLTGYITSQYSGFTPAKVLKAAQWLYENKYTTYPRTVSRHLEESLMPKMEKVLNAITVDFPYKDMVNFTDSKDVFNSSKVESHSAITPTYIIPDLKSLTDEQRIVYEEIKKRFLSLFMPPAEFEITEIKTKVKDFVFVTRGKVLIKDGWKVLYKNEKVEDADQGSDDEDSKTLLPNVKENYSVVVGSSDILSKKTTPPKHYTTKSLLLAMENCGKDVDEDCTDQILKGFTIGTPATAGATIDKVESVGYIEHKGKSIYITPVGIKLIEKLPLSELADVNFTGMLEKRLKDIEKRVYTKDEYLKEIKSLVISSVEKLKNINAVIGEKKEKEVIGKCPNCSSPVYESDSSFYCSAFKKDDPNGCKFAIFKGNKLLEKYGVKKVSVSLAKKLLNDGKTILNLNYSTFINISLEKQEGRWGLKFDFPSKDESTEMREIIGNCPDCGKRVFENPYAFTCEGYKKDDPNSCKFSIFKENSLLAKFEIKKISKAVAKDLLKMEKVQIKVSPTFNVFSFLEKKNNRWQVSFEFPSKENNLSMREVIGSCPECKKNVYENSFSFACEDNKKDNPNGCKFALYKDDKWFAKFKKKINKSIAKSLLKNFQTEVKGLFSEKTGKTFDANVILKKNGNYWGFELKFTNNKNNKS